VVKTTGGICLTTGFIKKNIRFSGVLGISILIHACLLLLIGGVVLIEGIRPHVKFNVAALSEDVSGKDVMEALEDEGSLGPENQNELPSPPQLPSLSESQSPAEFSKDMDSVPMSLLTTESPSSTALSAAMSGASGSFSFNGGVLGQGTAPGSGKGSAGSGLRGMGSLFGSKNAAEGGFAGYFYDLKQGPDGKPTSMMGHPGERGTPTQPVNVPALRVNEEARRVAEKFIRNWDPAVLKDFYRAPEPLYTQQFFIPNSEADNGPKAFGVDQQVQPKRWLVHYKGAVSAPRSGTFRFVGLGDDVLIVRFDGKEVLDASWIVTEKSFNDRETYEKPFASCPEQLRIGKWFTVTEGQSYHMEVLIGETLGGVFCNFLLMEEKGASYPARSTNGKSPRLPVFQASPTVIPAYRTEVDAPGVLGEGLVFSK
jgi:hypothetical protein